MAHFDEDRDILILSSGTELRCNMGIYGLTVSREYTGISGPTYGADGDLDWNNLTKEEKLEFVDFMIEEWQRFRVQVLSALNPTA